eukprot:GDKK01079059.1.p1 GENE.GDKK01079059.1~~GDKK01079059.1.p1  ORF type:complete len:455 (+),score=56.53 GDKK01079059.1:81-1445(+)
MTDPTTAVICLAPRENIRVRQGRHQNRTLTKAIWTAAQLHALKCSLNTDSISKESHLRNVQVDALKAQFITWKRKHLLKLANATQPLLRVNVTDLKRRAEQNTITMKPYNVYNRVSNTDSSQQVSWISMTMRNLTAIQNHIGCYSEPSTCKPTHVGNMVSRSLLAEAFCLKNDDQLTKENDGRLIETVNTLAGSNVLSSWTQITDQSEGLALLSPDSMQTNQERANNMQRTKIASILKEADTNDASKADTKDELDSIEEALAKQPILRTPPFSAIALQQALNSGFVNQYWTAGFRNKNVTLQQCLADAAHQSAVIVQYSSVAVQSDGSVLPFDLASESKRDTFMLSSVDGRDCSQIDKSIHLSQFTSTQYTSTNVSGFHTHCLYLTGRALSAMTTNLVTKNTDINAFPQLFNPKSHIKPDSLESKTQNPIIEDAASEHPPIGFSIFVANPLSRI